MSVGLLAGATAACEELDDSNVGYLKAEDQDSWCSLAVGAGGEEMSDEQTIDLAVKIAAANQVVIEPSQCAESVVDGGIYLFDKSDVPDVTSPPTSTSSTTTSTTTTTTESPPTTTTTTTTTIPPTTTTEPPPSTTTTTLPPTTTTTTIPPEDFDPNDHMHPAAAPPRAGEQAGNARFVCEFSHLAYDDPIVNPGQPGASHLHMFTGNTETDAFSDYDSLKNHGDSTCAGGPINRTGYWIPAVHDGAGKIRVPYVSVFYYKVFHQMLSVSEFPEGQRIIAGYNMATGQGGHFQWKCSNNTMSGTTIPDCPAGTDVIGIVGFPECHNGQLDSGDHRSHFTYKQHDTPCPASHPHLVSTITLNIWFHNPGNSENWYLDSDRMSEFPEQWKADGSTLHADWFGAWDREVLATWVNNCNRRDPFPEDGVREGFNCDNSEIGQWRSDGPRQLDNPPNYTGPEAIDPPPRPGG